MDNAVAAPSLYARYCFERNGYLLLERPEGFASYVIDGEMVYILDIYVVPEERHRGIATAMADEIVAIARAAGCKELFGSIDPLSHGSHGSMLGLLAYGMTVSHVNGSLVYFKKGI